MILSLPLEVIEAIAAECLIAPGVETGGLLAGVADGEQAIVLQSSGPGPKAICHRYYLQWDTEHLATWIADDVWEGAIPIGRWHKHCAPILMPSQEDKTSAEAFRRALELDGMVDLIVATMHDEPIGWSAYLCSAEGYERIQTNPSFAV